MIVALLTQGHRRAGPPQQSRATGDDDGPASLHEGANEIPSVPPPLAAHAAQTASDDLSHTKNHDAPSEAHSAI